MKSLSIANKFGNVDVRSGLSKRYVHVKGLRLTIICRRLKIKFAKALIDFQGKRKYGYKPVFDGVVVSAISAKKLLKAIAERKPSQPKPTIVERLIENGFEPDSRIGRAYLRGDVPRHKAEFIAFIAEYRHKYTDYDELLEQGADRETARILKTPYFNPEKWDDYLNKYDFNSPEAKALASILKSPQQAHPVWFKKAEIAVRLAKLDLSSLTYDQVRKAIMNSNLDD